MNLYYRQFARQWSREKYDDVVYPLGKSCNWKMLPLRKKILNRIHKALFVLEFWFGLFDLKLFFGRKQERLRRWRAGDPTYKNF